MPANDSSFARLYPANLQAKLAFDELVNELHLSPERFHHARQFIHIEGKVLLKEPDQIPLSPGQVSETDTDGGESPQDPREVFTGYYRFSFKPGPKSHSLGWVIGGGRRNKPFDEVDILIAKTRLPQCRLLGRHARLAFDRYGALSVINDHPKTPSVVLGDEEFTHGRRVLLRPKNRISFGDLAYVFEFLNMSEKDRATYQQNLATYLKDNLNSPPPPLALSATPSETDHTICDWIIKGTVGQGTFGTVMAARHRITGQVAGAKMVTRTLRNLATVMSEINLMRRLPKEPALSQIIDVIYERGSAWFSSPPNNALVPSSASTPERVYILLSPFVLGTFLDIFNARVSLQIRMLVFTQILEGVLALHKEGFMHRDIKPGNLGVVSYDPALAVILDFGQTVQQSTVAPTPGRIGTEGYLAPEMELETYNNGVDIWALGVVGLQLFLTQGLLRWHKFPDDRLIHQQTSISLSRLPNSSVEDLLGRMLRWDPAERISAKDALDHPCLREFRFQTLTDRDIYKGAKRPHASLTE